MRDDKIVAQVSKSLKKILNFQFIHACSLGNIKYTLKTYKLSAWYHTFSFLTLNF